MKMGSMGEEKMKSGDTWIKGEREKKTWRSK